MAPVKKSKSKSDEYDSDAEWAAMYLAWDGLSGEQQDALCNIYRRSPQEAADKAPSSMEPGSFVALLIEKC